VSWEVDPEPTDAEERAALVAAADRALALDKESAWWRSGLEDLSEGPPSELTWPDPRPVES
jgi:hypothetical protein